MGGIPPLSAVSPPKFLKKICPPPNPPPVDHMEFGGGDPPPVEGPSPSYFPENLPLSCARGENFEILDLEIRKFSPVALF